jgi:PAS domain S-box-containing protein
VDLAGRTVGDYSLTEMLGEGTASMVYLATHADGREVALKVLSPAVTAQRGFEERLEHSVGVIDGLSHPHIVPVHEYGRSAGLTYVARALTQGGSLAERIAGGPLGLNEVWDVLSQVSDALHAAHEAGLVHLDVKPSNIRYDERGKAMVADFGLAKMHLRFAVGTPAYMAPEQAVGDEADARADVYALAVVAFEMLTGTRLHGDLSVPDALLAVVESPVPSIRERRPDLPEELDEFFRRALAKERDLRPQSTVDLVWGLTRILVGGREAQNRRQAEIAQAAYKGQFLPAAAGSANGYSPDAERDFDRVRGQMMQLIETALTAGVAVDESCFIVGWNQQAAQTFGWPKDEILGRSLSSTIIPPQYREAHERGFQHFMATGEGPVLGKVIEITAMHRDGLEFPVELSISPAAREGRRCLFVAYARDITREHRERQLAAAKNALAEIHSRDPAELGSRVLEALGTALGWSVGILWEPDDGYVRCKHFWKAEDTGSGELETAAREATLSRDSGLPGRVWGAGDVVWVEDILHEAGLPLALAAVRDDLRTAVGVPVPHGGEIRAVLEFLGPRTPPDDLIMDRLYDLGRRAGQVMEQASSTKTHIKTKAPAEAD